MATKQTGKSKVELIADAEKTGKWAGIDGRCAICGKNANHPIGSTCTKHVGLVGKFYTTLTAKQIGTDGKPKPELGLTPIAKLCDLAEELGMSRTWAVSLCGGDAGTKEPAKGCEVYVTGKAPKVRKFVKQTAFELVRERAPKA